jgi:hypothetical protein
MHTFTNPTILLTLSVVLSGVQAHVARPRTNANLVCHEDSELRALERFSSYADEFCPEYLSTGRKPKWLNQWNSKKVSSACKCYEKTASSLGPTSTGALAALSTAPPALTAVFATPSASAGGSVAPVTTAASSSAADIPSPVVSSSDSAVAVRPTTASVTHVTPPNTVIPVRSPSASASASASLSKAATTASESTPVTPIQSSELTPMSPSLPAGDTYPPQPFGAGPGKRGLAYDYKTQNGWSAYFKGSPFATYGSNWGLDRTVGDLDASFSYVPTVAVDASLSNADWNSSVPVLIEGGTKALFA